MVAPLPPARWRRRRLSRRQALRVGGLALVWTLVPRPAHPAAGDTIEVHLQSDTLGTDVGFDPIGLHIAPGTTVRWVVDANVHTVTAYHPRNGSHSLRIPTEAQPFDSGFLLNPGDRFAVRLTVEGVYDYFCLPHEFAGMVGRIVVGPITTGRPGGPGALPFDYFKSLPEGKGWMEVPPAAQAAFPSVEAILRDRIVPRKPGNGHGEHGA